MLRSSFLGTLAREGVTHPFKVGLRSIPLKLSYFLGVHMARIILVLFAMLKPNIDRAQPFGRDIFVLRTVHAVAYCEISTEAKSIVRIKTTNPCRMVALQWKLNSTFSKPMATVTLQSVERVQHLVTAKCKLNSMNC